MTGGYGKYGKLVNFRLPIEDYEKMMELAKADDRPTTYYLREAVHQYLQGVQQRDVNLEKTLERLQAWVEMFGKAAADQGEHEHEEGKMYFSDFMKKIIQEKDENEK